ncbi:MAG: hypothetical protein K8R76_09055 [Candidatus Aegiribacteria sp.]|nr:hypothetical protein [Candidatus Aegiribacteria sp.]
MKFGDYMLYSWLLTMVLFSTPSDIGDILPAFRDSIIRGNGSGAVEMISEHAVYVVDSVLAHDPGQIARIVSYFGIELALPDEGSADARQILTDILSDPSVAGMVMLMGVSSGDPISSGERTFIPVDWGLPGSRDTLFIEIVSENEQWKINDYFEVIPSGRGS